MVTFRALDEQDFGLLAVWLARDHVQQWWCDPSAPSNVADKYGPRVRGDAPTQVFIVRLRDSDIGLIQRYRIVDHPDWLQTLAKTGFDPRQAAGIDYLIGELGTIGRGVGTDMIRAFTAELFIDYPDVTSIAVTPQATNAASCRVLEKAGYARRWIGVLESDDPSDAGEAALYVKEREEK